jgi:hypothetical protein
VADIQLASWDDAVSRVEAIMREFAERYAADNGAAAKGTR